MGPAVAKAVPRQRSARREERRIDLVEIVSGARPARLVFQPIVDVQRGVAVGYEALARFSARLTTSPGPWFAAAHGTPHAAPLEAVLVRAALEARQGLPVGSFISINVTPAVLHHPDVLRAFGSGGDLSDVVVELTEHAPVLSAFDLRQAVAALRQRGARFALDDVGVGWGGLKQVMDLRPEIVKLDRALVSEAPADPVRQAIAQMLLDLCSRLGLDLLVEGVETYDELDLFARMGVPLAQGFVFGRPDTTTARLVDDDLAVRLKFRAGLTRRADQIAAHVDLSAADIRAEDGPAIADLPVGDGPAAAEDRGGEAAPRPVVLVDGAGRPIGMLTYDATGTEQRHDVLAVTAAEDVQSVAHRAMTRPSADRFIPVVCVDRSGRHVGVVPIDALVKALASPPREAPSREVRLP